MCVFGYLFQQLRPAFLGARGQYNAASGATFDEEVCSKWLLAVVWSTEGFSKTVDNISRIWLDPWLAMTSKMSMRSSAMDPDPDETEYFYSISRNLRQLPVDCQWYGRSSVPYIDEQYTSMDVLRAPEVLVDPKISRASEEVPCTPPNSENGTEFEDSDSEAGYAQCNSGSPQERSPSPPSNHS